MILIPPLLPFSLRRILSRSKSCIEPGTIFEFPVPFETIVDEYAADQKLMVEEEVDRRKNPRCPRQRHGYVRVWTT